MVISRPTLTTAIFIIFCLMSTPLLADNSATLVQTGTSASASIRQTGSNRADLLQDGSNNSTDLSQQGDLNVIDELQLQDGSP